MHDGAGYLNVVFTTQIRTSVNYENTRTQQLQSLNNASLLLHTELILVVGANDTLALASSTLSVLGD